MNNNDVLFSKEMLSQMQPVVASANRALRVIPLMILTVALLAAVQLPVAIVEIEIMYRIFAYMSSDGYQFFSPRLLSLTGILMIIGFHLYAEHHPLHPVVRLIETIAIGFIACYVLGTGFYMASMLRDSGLGLDAGFDPEFFSGSLDTLQEKGWIDTAFETFADPFGVLAVSLGLGGLAVVNLYISHRIISAIRSIVVDINTRRTRHQSIHEDYQAVLSAQQRYAACSDELWELAMYDRNYLALELASTTLEHVHQQLLPHEQLLQEDRYDSQRTVDGVSNPTDYKEIRKAVDKIKSITVDDILRDLKDKTLEDKSDE